MRFLIVDDSRAIQTIVRRAIQKARIPDVEFQVAGDGVEALKVMDEWQPNMVLTDWHMPGMSGIELLKAIRSRNGGAEVKVGFVTTESTPAHRDEALELGALFFINKPFTDEELVQVVRKAMEDETPVATTEAGVVVTISPLNAVVALMDSALGRKVMVFDLPRGVTDEIQLPSAVGLYAHVRSGEIRAMCLLDHRAILLIGGTAAGMSLPDVSAAMSSKEVPSAIWEPTLDMLRNEMNKSFVCSDGSRLTLMKGQLLKHHPPQLKELMRRSPLRSDFSVTRSKLTAGHMTFFCK